ncbi:MAG TPA: DUF5671 domain-containing protein [Acidimicrobiia bacterium]
MASITFIALLLMVLVAVVVIGAAAVIRRSRPEHKRDDVAVGADVVTYLILAAAVMVLGFSVSSLARTAFPGGPFVFDPETRVATALASIAVSLPVSVILWIRQRGRRLEGGGIGGWTIYLALIEVAFTTSLLVAWHQLLEGLFTGTGDFFLSDLIVYLAVFGFHEYAVRDTPLPKTAHEIPLTLGALIGFVPLVWGVGGIIFEGLSAIYEGLANVPYFGPGPLESIAMLLTGLPVWAYRWFHRWAGGPGPARRAWAIVVAVGSMTAILGAGALTLTNVLTYLVDRPDAGAARHFDFLPAALTVAIVGYAAWQHHRSILGRERTDSVRFYEYLLAAIGMLGLVSMSSLLVTAVFTDGLFASNVNLVFLSVVGGLTALGLWHRYWGRGQDAPRSEEAASTARRLYLLVLGVITAVTSAIALISFLVMVFRAALGVDGLSDAAAPVASLFVTSGLAAWHLLRAYSADRAMFDEGVEIEPFDVILITSHPGRIANLFPRQAKLRVMYRDDAHGAIDDEMADQIVAAVHNRSAVVWVDDTGFRVAHLR